MLKNLVLLVVLISFVFVSANQTSDNCVIIYDFILEHYNGTLNYLSYEFEDLKSETNLTTIELKDYLINYEDKCYLMLPYENYTVKQENEIQPDTKQTITNFLKSMFDEPKSFLMTISFLIVIILLIKMIQDSR